MKTRQAIWASGSWQGVESLERPPDLVLLFGQRALLSGEAALTSLAKTWPRERFHGCSTAGEIAGPHVSDGTVVATAVWLDKASYQSACVAVSAAPDGEALGRALVAQLKTEGVVHVLVFSDGTTVNGSELVRGLIAALPASVTVSGGLSGDGDEMKATVVCHRGEVAGGIVSVLAFKGPLEVGIGTMGGWDAFGPKRIATRSTANVLYELDGEPALALYKRYLGEHAAQLPSSALLFPLMVHRPGDLQSVVRTILGVNEADGSLVFAGDVPQGSQAQLMRANFDRLVQGASGAAQATSFKSGKAELALLISCVGRKLILKQRTDEELEAVAEVLGEHVPLTGFYSYGELGAFTRADACQLHNQTMTVTTFKET